MYGKTRGDIGNIIRSLCRQKKVELMECHAMPDHLHLVLSIPPEYSLAMVATYLKGKSAVQIHRKMLGVKKGFSGKHFWSRRCYVSTVGLDAAMIRTNV